MAARKKSENTTILKEGFLFKKSDILKWHKRYCVLNRDSFCYFKGENKAGHKSSSGRIFLSDVAAVEIDPPGIKKPFVLGIRLVNGDFIIFQAASKEDRESWKSSIDGAKEREHTREQEDPLRRSMKKLTRDLKRATLTKDPEHGGIGCFLSSDYEGRVFVETIIEGGPLAGCGVLREGDEILEVKDIPLKGKSIKDILDIISECPSDFPVTVRPIVPKKSSVAKPLLYATIDDLPENTEHTPDSTASPTPPVPPKNALSFQFVHDSKSGLKADKQHTIVLEGPRGRAHVYEDLDYTLSEMEGTQPSHRAELHPPPPSDVQSGKKHSIVLEGPRGRAHVYEDPDYTLNKMDRMISSQVRELPPTPPPESSSRVHHPYEEIELLEQSTLD